MQLLWHRHRGFPVAASSFSSGFRSAAFPYYGIRQHAESGAAAAALPPRVCTENQARTERSESSEQMIRTNDESKGCQFF